MSLWSVINCLRATASTSASWLISGAGWSSLCFYIVLYFFRFRLLVINAKLFDNFHDFEL